MKCPKCQEVMGKENKVHLKLENTSAQELPDEVDIVATEKWICPGCATRVEVPERFGYTREESDEPTD